MYKRLLTEEELDRAYRVFLKLVPHVSVFGGTGRYMRWGNTGHGEEWKTFERFIEVYVKSIPYEIRQGWERVA